MFPPRARGQAGRKGFFDGPPDLAVEVVSPGDTDEAVQMKVLDYLRAGTQAVWVISPRTRTVMVYTSFQAIRVLVEDDVLDGGEVVPGFTLAVAQLFE